MAPLLRAVTQEIQADACARRALAPGRVKSARSAPICELSSRAAVARCDLRDLFAVGASARRHSWRPLATSVAGGLQGLQLPSLQLRRYGSGAYRANVSTL